MSIGELLIIGLILTNKADEYMEKDEVGWGFVYGILGVISFSVASYRIFNP